MLWYVFHSCLVQRWFWRFSPSHISKHKLLVYKCYAVLTWYSLSGSRFITQQTAYYTLMLWRATLLFPLGIKFIPLKNMARPLLHSVIMICVLIEMSLSLQINTFYAVNGVTLLSKKDMFSVVFVCWYGIVLITMFSWCFFVNRNKHHLFYKLIFYPVIITYP